MSLARNVLAGGVAGAAGTLAMDLVWFTRYKRGGGTSDFFKWEFAVGLNSWENASAPAKVGKLLYETFSHRELPANKAALTTNVMHWAYGVQWGVLLSTALGAPRHVRWWQAPTFGVLVWLAGYVSLPVAGFYKPIWGYGPKTLWDDLSAHLVFGATAVMTYWASRLDTARWRLTGLARLEPAPWRRHRASGPRSRVVGTSGASGPQSAARRRGLAARWVASTASSRPRSGRSRPGWPA